MQSRQRATWPKVQVRTPGWAYPCGLHLQGPSSSTENALGHHTVGLPELAQRLRVPLRVTPTAVPVAAAIG